jgi:hypothetical protein
VKRWIQRTLLHLQYIFGDLLEPLRDRVTVDWTQRNDLEDEHVERALQKVTLWSHDA